MNSQTVTPDVASEVVTANRADLRSLERDPRKRVEFTGRDEAGDWTSHVSAFTKSPLLHRKARRRAAGRAARAARRAGR